MKKNALVLSIFAALSFTAQAEVVLGKTIMDLQGDSWFSPYTDPAKGKYISDETFVVEGLVTAVQTKKLGGDLPVGFFIQDKDGDGNPNTSEGIFVEGTYVDGGILGLNVGDEVAVTGKVKEHFSWTQIVGPEAKVGPAVNILSKGNELPEARVIRALETDENFSFTLERHEGMLVTFAKESDMRVTRTYGYDYGPYRNNMVVANGRVNQHPNQSNVPGSKEAAEQTNSNKDKRVIVESFNKAPNGVVPWYPDFGRTDINQDGSTEDYIRIGDRVEGLEGVLTYSYNDYRLFVTNEADQNTFVREGSDRSEAPVLKEGDLRVATFNVLNYFNSPFGGDQNPTNSNRGATTADDFERQAAKIVNAMTALDADILGLMEIENNGFGENSAVADLVNRLNEKLDEADHYSISEPDSEELTNGFIGTDAITTQVIFKASKVSLDTVRVIQMPEQHAGPVTIKIKGKDKTISGSSYMRNAVTPTFTIAGSDEKLTVSVNHFKSKGSACWEDYALQDGGDPDLQGSCENFRVSGAYQLGQVMATIDGHKLILGDLNSYANEDAIMVLTNRDNAPADYVLKAARSTFIGDQPLHGEDGAVITESYGYTNVIKDLHPASHSYSYGDEVGTLDYILASASLKSMVVDGMDWNINSSESTLFEYPSKYSGDMPKYNDAYSSSDHDPAIVVLNFGLNIDPEPEVTPDLPANVELPLDAPAVPSGIKSGEAFKVSLNMLEASKNASDKLLVGDIASVIINDEVNKHSVKLSSTQQKILAAADFEAGYTVFEISGLEAGDYTMRNIITDASGKQKFADQPLVFSVTDSVDSNVTPEEKSGGAAGLWALAGLFGFAFVRRKTAK
ncbi:ExeM/NucH family extracellular endonuclease [Psychromonas aquimarina]|uniref:ExeM/NucH family extracellular endonuclease n=1 Tax=Psychromonas aquimarina TaxID=444919 RepID=UPI0003FF169E|nr:ExeM/NucH family extracellular endonuclease [Psychromonas aquimarina]